VAVYLEKFSNQTGQLYHGAGCDACHHTGYKGRIGLYEFLELDDEMRDMITHNPSLGELRAAAVEKGMRSLREDGLMKAFQGDSTVEELIRVTES